MNREKTLSGQLHSRLSEAIAAIKAYSSHEHLYPEPEYLRRKLDFSTLLVPYLNLTLSALGMPGERINMLADTEISEEEKWAIFEPFRESLFNLDSFLNIQIVARDLYGINDMAEDTYQQLGAAMRAAQKPGHYQEVFDKSRLEYALVDYDISSVDTSEYDQNCFGLIYRIQNEWLGRNYYEKAGITSIDQVFEAIDKHVARLTKAGLKGIKLAMAAGGMIPLSFKQWSRAEAEASFNKLMSTEDIAIDKVRPFVDSVIFRFVRNAVEHNLIVQVHTAMQSYSAGEPYLLKGMIDAFPEAKIDLFHAGYPYDGQLAVLSMFFGNVYPDLCWMALVSKTLTKRLLSEWLEMVPVGKILANGSDMIFIDNIYAYQKVIRQIVVEVLEEKIIAGRYTEAEAIQIAKMILRKNLQALLTR